MSHAKEAQRIRDRAEADEGYSDSIYLTPEHLREKHYRTDNPWKSETAAQLLASSSRLAGTASSLLGADVIRLYLDSTRFKEPGEPANPWRVDLAAAPFQTERLLSVYLALVDIEPRMGPPEFAKGSHRAEVTGWDLDDSQIRNDFEVQGAVIDTPVSLHLWIQLFISAPISCC